jgi:hypothetical protein
MYLKVHWLTSGGQKLLLPLCPPIQTVQCYVQFDKPILPPELIYFNKCYNRPNVSPMSGTKLHQKWDGNEFIQINYTVSFVMIIKELVKCWNVIW